MLGVGYRAHSTHTVWKAPCNCAHSACAVRVHSSVHTLYTEKVHITHKKGPWDCACATQAVRKGLFDCAHPTHTIRKSSWDCVHRKGPRDCILTTHRNRAMWLCTLHMQLQKVQATVHTRTRPPPTHTYSDSAHTTRAVRKGLLDCVYPMHAVRKSPCECAHSTQKRSMRLCTQSTLEKIHAIVYTPQSVRKGPRDLPLARPLLWARPPSSQSHRPEEALRTPTEPRQHGRPAPPTVPSPAKPAGGRHPGQCPRPCAHSPGRPRRL